MTVLWLVAKTWPIDYLTIYLKIIHQQETCLCTYFGKFAKYLLCFSRRTSSVNREYVLLIQTLRRKFVSESLILSNLCAHSCNILLRSSRNRNLADIIGTRGRVWRKGEVRGGPNISESSSAEFNVVVGRVISI